MKRRIILESIIISSILLTGCCLSHEFSEPTCTELSTCSKCGETQGELLEHTFSDATCQTPKTCTECGLTEGEALPHNFIEATCSVCGHIDTKTNADRGASSGEVIIQTDQELDAWKNSEEGQKELSKNESLKALESETREDMYADIAAELGLTVEEVRELANGGSNGGGGSTPVATPETNQSAADENSFVTPETSGSSNINPSGTGSQDVLSDSEIEAILRANNEAAGDGGKLITDIMINP